MTIAALAGSFSDFKMSSQNLLSKPRGRLSTQKKPRSSSARRKVPFPEPLRPVRMMKDDVCMRRRPFYPGRGCGKRRLGRCSRFRLNPTDIYILSFVNNVQALCIGVTEHQEFAVGIFHLNGGVVHTHRLGCHVVRADDATQPLSQSLLNFNNRCGRNDLPLMVVVM